MKNLSDLISQLGHEVIKRYEAHTGISGLGAVINPIVSETANDYLGKVKLDPNGLKAIIDIFGAVQPHWGRLTNNGETKVEQQQQQSLAQPRRPLPGEPIGYVRPNVRG